MFVYTIIENDSFISIISLKNGIDIENDFTMEFIPFGAVRVCERGEDLILWSLMILNLN